MVCVCVCVCVGGGGGVDLADQFNSYYENDHTSRGAKYYLRLFFDLMNTCIVNSEIVFNKIQENHQLPIIQSLEFRRTIVRKLIDWFTKDEFILFLQQHLKRCIKLTTFKRSAVNAYAWLLKRRAYKMSEGPSQIHPFSTSAVGMESWANSYALYQVPLFLYEMRTRGRVWGGGGGGIHYCVLNVCPHGRRLIRRSFSGSELSG